MISSSFNQEKAINVIKKSEDFYGWKQQAVCLSGRLALHVYELVFVELYLFFPVAS